MTKTVLVIDDDVTVLESLAAFLEDNDYNVITADNGATGIATFTKEQPDLVLTDLRMPKMDGYEVLSKIKQQSAKTPVIVISGQGEITGAIDALRKGAWDYIMKPLTEMSILPIAIERALERAHLMQENDNHQKSLEKRVLERTNELNEANEILNSFISKLERKNTELELFNYTVSHDLKTPLVTIGGYNDLIQIEAETLNNKTIDAHSSVIAKTVTRMNTLLDELLEYSRLGTIDLPKTNICMDSLLNDVINLFGPALEQHHIVIDIKGPLGYAYGEKVRIFEVVQNIIGNAIKYRGDNKKPIIEINKYQKNDSDIFEFKDYGIGIDPKYHEKPFMLFEQIDPKAEGSGIGLAIVAKIFKQHGGKVWLKSEGLGHGTTFGFLLPKNPNDPD